MTTIALPDSILSESEPATMEEIIIAMLTRQPHISYGKDVLVDGPVRQLQNVYDGAIGTSRSVPSSLREADFHRANPACD